MAVDTTSQEVIEPVESAQEEEQLVQYSIRPAI